MAGSWSTKLHTILRPAWDSPHDDSRNPKTHRHAPRATWKRILGKSVFLDLAGETFERRRRFVRLETLGLSGIIFYEISSINGSDSLVELSDETTSVIPLTRSAVFGDPRIPSDSGMGIDKLIDAVGAKVLYFPAYACTSFISGQAMNAFLYGCPDLLPLPTSEGFSVNAVTISPSCISLTEKSVNTPRLPLLQKYPPSISILSMTAPSKASDIASPNSSFSGSNLDETDISTLSISSIGLCTPPRVLHSGEVIKAVNPSNSFAFGEETELGYVLCDAIDFFSRPASLEILVTQDARTNFSKLLSAGEKENIVPDMKV